jgi:hypothetical protein
VKRVRISEAKLYFEDRKKNTRNQERGDKRANKDEETERKHQEKWE